MYYKQTQLQKMFSVGSTTCTKICRLIDKNEDRYGQYASIGTRYSDAAFADAMKHRHELERGEVIEPFVPEQVLRFNLESESVCQDYFDAGARKVRNEIFDQVDQYFRETRFPEEAEPFKKAIRASILAIVVTAEATP